MAQSALSEISRLKIPINKGDTPFLSWEDSMLTLVSEKTVTIFKLTHNVQCMDKKIDWNITDILCPKTSPATSLFSKKMMKQNNIKNIDYIQMMLDPALWPHNVQLMEELASVVSIQWSSPNFVHNNERVIAVLNNIGNVEVFAPASCGYSSLLNISSTIESQYKNTSEGSLPHEVAEVKKIADALETCACCWGAQYNDAFNFVTAQKNGDIHFWKLQSANGEISIEKLIVEHSDAGEIVTMQWIPISNVVFLLVLANILGQLYVYKYQWENNCPKLINRGCPWPHKDRMAVRHLKYRVVNDRIMLICNKHRHLLVLLIDDTCNKVSEYVNNLNDYKITVISESNKHFYIGTINCTIYKVDIMLTDGTLNVNVEEKTFKENFTNHDLCGLGFSKNSVICALAVLNRKILFRKENVALDVIFLCEEENYGRELTLLLQNPTQKLTDYWDCLELLRCKVLRLKTLPAIGYSQLYLNQNIYENKLYLIILNYYHTLENLLKNNSTGCLPETSLEVTKEWIFALHAKSMISEFADICRKKQNSDVLTDLDTQTYSCAKKYIKYYCDKYKKNLAELVPSGFDNTKDFDIICQCCDETLKGFSCSKGHINMFCGLTLTPIESSDYLSCSACGLIARKELEPENPMCLFCDLHLNTYFLPT
ncbi:uncharacterized protein LOC133528904 [Cydia pomonella]|uniref:uncharacterized protein LOC133528904 n=1 Tax=Cydia pomonella TaxID=82600 RepID=UPI002ADE922E|nr:uncharacterized protein LOC133528904 [Cydia pomonella]